MDSQIVEIVGPNELIRQLLCAGLEVSIPLRDRGIDVIAYADLFANVERFVARPIQMKAASNRSFGLDRKYAKFPNLLIAFVWHLDCEEPETTFALSYEEACRVAETMGYTNTTSWERGNSAQPDEPAAAAGAVASVAVPSLARNARSARVNPSPLAVS